ncbi:hypothetical protein CROQUDRAFT_108805 [Cronartium quercuum f. sp. fusiforme G11]|uniref:Uncharacterized protein n=1 Tax=Cronartium quercuum f. sp. fusiforme G11 TaxID=708437 RepID=A0A9P6NE92_9BASI|nr:hypothetical protein CROQUDRAFT_108805 [Cronartium quercuum f. sp. fusiforme G11]
MKHETSKLKLPFNKSLLHSPEAFPAVTKFAIYRPNFTPRSDVSAYPGCAPERVPQTSFQTPEGSHQTYHIHITQSASDTFPTHEHNIALRSIDSVQTSATPVQKTERLPSIWARTVIRGSRKA